MPRITAAELRTGDVVGMGGDSYTVKAATATSDGHLIVWAHTNGEQPYGYDGTESWELISRAATATEILARAILIGGDADEDTDHLEILESIRSILTPEHFTAVAESMEVCPIHVCDVEICIDDEETCQTP